MHVIWLSVICVLILRNSNAQLHEYFEEVCPPDSIKVEDICKCDHTLCEKPPCESLLVQLTNLSNIPGSCCPTYSCEGCAKEDQIEGMCPCLPGAIIRSGRKCECANRHYTLINGTCECDTNRCELPDLCDDRSVSVKEFDGCCEKIKCIQCPDDSYPSSYNGTELEDKCLCFPCPSFQCNETQPYQILMKGKHVAGQCCDIYSCENGCLVNGTVYSEGKNWTTSDSQCKCLNGISHCSPLTDNEPLRTCLAGGIVYQHLETWVEDSCTNCTCEKGKAKCIAHMCDVHASEIKPPLIDCPSLSNCKKACENGYRLNKQGCETCKCRIDKTVLQNKTNKLNILLQEYNLTEDDLIILIKNRIQYEEMKNFEATSTSTTTTPAPVSPSTTICITEHRNTRGDCTYSCILEYGIPGFVVGAIFAGILLFTFLKCSERNRQKYKMHYNYKPVGKEALDKNLNISPIIKSKNFELKSYNEKKNVI